MGSRWKMFNKTQGQELIDKTTSTWTSINGVNGRKFTSKTDTSKYIFLPAGGVWTNLNHNNVGINGGYWSTTLQSSSSTWSLNLSTATAVMYSTNPRYSGYTVRAII